MITTWALAMALAADPEQGADPRDVRDRIERNLLSLETELKEPAANPKAVELQKQILADIDWLLKQEPPPQPPPQGPPPPPNGPPPPSPPDASQPPQAGGQPPPSPSGGTPPPPAGSQPPPSGGGNQPQPQGGSPSPSPRQQRKQQAQAGKGQPTGAQPQGKSGGAPQPAKPDDKQPPSAAGQPGDTPPPPPPPPEKESMRELLKDIWGHLPEKLRQEVDQYEREEFMLRHRELIQRYYSKLAEANRTRPQP